MAHSAGFPLAPASPQGRTRMFPDGFLYASAGRDARSRRHSASLLISLTDAPLEVEAGGQVQQGLALAVGPSVSKWLHAEGRPFACIDTDASHPLFRSFAGLPEPGVAVLPHEAFAPAISSLERFRLGELDTPRASRLLFRRVVEIARGLLPAPLPLDPRVRRVMSLLDEDPTRSVADLADSIYLSRDRLSHLFTQEMGLPLRTYAQSLKLRAAARLIGSGLNFTQIAAAAGFTDSAHFSKTWAQFYGASPTHFALGHEVLIYPAVPAGTEATLTDASRLRSRDTANEHERMPSKA